MGEGDVKAKSEDGIEIDLTAQIGDKIRRMLIAVGRAVDAGNMVVFGADRNALRDLADKKDLSEHVIMSKKTGITSKMQKKDGLFVYPLWIKRPRDKMGNPKTSVATLDKDDEMWTPF